MKKQDKIKAVWTQDGHIIIKVSDASDPVPIQPHRLDIDTNLMKQRSRT